MIIRIDSRVYGIQDVLIDDEDFDKVRQYGWYVQKLNDSLYVYATKYDSKTQKSKPFLLHRYLMDFPQKMIVDHIDHNPLNNKKSNLRVTNSTGSNRNVRVSKSNKLGVKGVHFSKTKKKYITQITVDYKPIHGGSFNTIKEASDKYDELALKHFGEYANLNSTPIKKDSYEGHRVYIQPTHNTTGYRGVFNWRNGTFFSKIVVNRKQIYLGYNLGKKEAALLYNKAALKYYGIKAILNET